MTDRDQPDEPDEVEALRRQLGALVEDVVEHPNALPTLLAAAKRQQRRRPAARVWLPAIAAAVTLILLGLWTMVPRLGSGPPANENPVPPVTPAPVSKSAADQLVECLRAVQVPPGAADPANRIAEQNFKLGARVGGDAPIGLLMLYRGDGQVNACPLVSGRSEMMRPAPGIATLLHPYPVAFKEYSVAHNMVTIGGAIGPEVAKVVLDTTERSAPAALVGRTFAGQLSGVDPLDYRNLKISFYDRENRLLTQTSAF